MRHRPANRQPRVRKLVLVRSDCLRLLLRLSLSSMVLAGGSGRLRAGQDLSIPVGGGRILIQSPRLSHVPDDGVELSFAAVNQTASEWDALTIEFAGVARCRTAPAVRSWRQEVPFALPWRKEVAYRREIKGWRLTSELWHAQGCEPVDSTLTARLLRAENDRRRYDAATAEWLEISPSLPVPVPEPAEESAESLAVWAVPLPVWPAQGVPPVQATTPAAKKARKKTTARAHAKKHRR